MNKDRKSGCYYVKPYKTLWRRAYWIENEKAWSIKGSNLKFYDTDFSQIDENQIIRAGDEKTMPTAVDILYDFKGIDASNFRAPISSELAESILDKINNSKPNNEIYMTIYFVADEKGKIIVSSCAETKKKAIERFTYPALRWKECADSGYKVIPVVINHYKSKYID